MAAPIRPLRPEDAPALLALRLRALREHPDAFATSEAEESQRPPAELSRRLLPDPGRVTLGAFGPDGLLGFAALVRASKARQRHRATLAGMYVAPEARGERVGRALLDRALEVAAEWGVSDVDLAVTVGNQAARTLYARAGFVAYGVQPRGLIVDGRAFDVELMSLRLQ